MYVQRQGWWVRMPGRVANWITAMQTFLSLQIDSSSIFKKSSFKIQRLLVPTLCYLKIRGFLEARKEFRGNTSASPSKPCRGGLMGN